MKKDSLVKLDNDVQTTKKDLFTKMETQQNYTEKLIKETERTTERIIRQ